MRAWCRIIRLRRVTRAAAQLSCQQRNDARLSRETVPADHRPQRAFVSEPPQPRPRLGQLSGTVPVGWLLPTAPRKATGGFAVIHAGHQPALQARKASQQHRDHGQNSNQFHFQLALSSCITRRRRIRPTSHRSDAQRQQCVPANGTNVDVTQQGTLVCSI